MLRLLTAGRQNNLMSRNNVDHKCLKKFPQNLGTAKDKKINGTGKWVHFSCLVASSTRCNTLNIPTKYCLRYKNNYTFIHQY